MADQLSNLTASIPSLSGEKWRELPKALRAHDAWADVVQSAPSDIPKPLKDFLASYGPKEDVPLLITVDGHVVLERGVKISVPLGLKKSHHVFDEIHQSLCAPLAIQTQKQQLWIIDWQTSSSATIRQHHHLILEDDASLNVTWCALGDREAKGLNHAKISWKLGKRAKLDVYHLQDLSKMAMHFMTGSGQQDTGASISVKECRLGAQESWVEWLVDLKKEQSTWSWQELSLPKEDQVHIGWSEIQQKGKATSSESISRSLVEDCATSKVRTWVILQPGCTDAQAEQHHRHWQLSNRAKVESLPHLEVHHDQVACHHGVVIAGLDDEALFYLQSRGLSPQDAKAMLAKAFIEEGLESWDAGMLDIPHLLQHR